MSKSTKKKKVIVIGAGPGGLSAGMILASRGFEVVVHEKKDRVGGRNAPLTADGFVFETGPTFVMLSQVFEEVFSLAGRKMSDYLEFIRLDPLYRLRFGLHDDFRVYFDKEKIQREIEEKFPGEEKSYERYLKHEKRKFKKTYECLKVPYMKWYHYFRWKLLKALPYMQNLKSVDEVLTAFFRDERIKLSMTFQTKYLGMSPWECPGAFSILSYAEHGYGIYHPKGGVHKISEAMADVIREYGGMIRLSNPVREILFEGKKAVGVRLDGGEEERGDFVVMNSDFGYGVRTLIPEKIRKRYSDKKVEEKEYSCSTFMLYLGLDITYDIPHHNIFFSSDYKKNIEDIFVEKRLPDDPSFYVHNPAVTDDTLAPKGKSAVYVLVPVPNNTAKIDWSAEAESFKERVLQKISERSEMKDITAHIETMRVMTPPQWEKDVCVYRGAVFNLSHVISQMLYMRPHNEFDDTENLYLAGGGTHPGSGLPTILESGRIAADLIWKKVR